MRKEHIVIIVLAVLLVGVSVAWVISSQPSEPYVHSKLLESPTIVIPAYTTNSSWILNWTPTTDVRIVRIQVWMGNPVNVTWERALGCLEIVVDLVVAVAFCVSLFDGLFHSGKQQKAYFTENVSLGPNIILSFRKLGF